AAHPGAAAHAQPGGCLVGATRTCRALCHLRSPCGRLRMQLAPVAYRCAALVQLSLPGDGGELSVELSILSLRRTKVPIPPERLPRDRRLKWIREYERFSCENSHWGGAVEKEVTMPTREPDFVLPPAPKETRWLKQRS